MSPVGPFDIAPEQVIRLGSTLFATLINKLLELEAQASDIPGRDLELTYNITTPDGGVDADLSSQAESGWIPSGKSVWQFKAMNLAPKACAKELKSATRVHQAIREGATYVLAISADLPANLIANRHIALLNQAVALNLLTQADGGRILVYSATQLARWAATFPSITGSQLIGGPTAIADFDSWSSGVPHTYNWTPTDDRTAAIHAIREALREPGVVHLRIQGESGVGKTRLVMESVRDQALSPFVAYVSDEQRLDMATTRYLSNEMRQTILVVDECDADRHVKVLEKVPHNANIKLITMGEPGVMPPEARLVRLQGLSTEKVEEFVQSNFPGLGPEERRFIANFCYGNVQWAANLAGAIISTGHAEAAEIIARHDIERFVTAILPEGRDFLSFAVLALLERVGWDRELSYQKELLAEFLGTSPEDLSQVGESLLNAGLITKRGRYRQVSPLPLAAYLAARAWELRGDHILTELLPKLDSEMALGLFRRAADLGRFSRMTDVLRRVLRPGGGFDSLEELADNRRASQLVQLAIVMPNEVAEHVAGLIDDVDEEELHRLAGVRRDLVWTLEKLVWHTATFRTAADCLLRLALAENETYGNNATGTWLGLFAVMLPNTAADPVQRTAYLDEQAASADPRIRQLALRASAHAFNPNHETVMVSGELQAGALVEPRGQPATWADVWAYQSAAAARVVQLLEDEDEDIRKAAADALIKNLHPVLESRRLLEQITPAIAALPPEQLTEARRAAVKLANLFGRVELASEDVRPGALEWFLSQLPAEEPVDELETLLGSNRWDFKDEELVYRMEAVVASLDEDARQRLLQRLATATFPASWEAGRGLACAGYSDSDALAALTADAEASFAALTGFLYGMWEGDAQYFDSFLQSDLGRGLDEGIRLVIAVRAPLSAITAEIVDTVIGSLPVAAGANGSYAWTRNADAATVSRYLASWLPRIEDDADYQAVVQWMNVWLPHQGPAELPDELREQFWDLVALRSAHPTMGHESFGWCRLATVVLSGHERDAANLLLTGTTDAQWMLHESDYEAELLREASKQAPEAVWDLVAERLDQRDWRLEMQIRGWLLDSFSPDLIMDWIAGSLDKARWVAGLASGKPGQPGLWSRLLTDFPRDSEIESRLYGAFITGGWTGPMSEYVAGQIATMSQVLTGTWSAGVKHWARVCKKGLEEQRDAALEREAEGGF